MRNRKTFTALIIIAVIALSSIVSSIAIYSATAENKSNIELSENKKQNSSTYIQKTPELTLAPTPIATAVPNKPKYIFYIIGDGMGFSHLLLGAVYEKILNSDFMYTPYWDRFDIKKDCTAGRESAGGGTMLATGYDGEMDRISTDAEGNVLVTILDRASDAGLSTGVISNSYIVDATPATFLAHTNNRGEHQNIISQIPESGVNFVASGGMNYLLDDSLGSAYGSQDICGTSYSFRGSSEAIKKFSQYGYLTYLGQEASEFITQKGTYNFDMNKLFMLFTAKNMSYQRTKYGSRMEDMQFHEPDLDELTQAGIDMLSKNDDGFMLVIEEAMIDKSSHNNWMGITSVEMHILNKTLEVVFDFYNKHPYETLIIFTADHETGDMTYNTDFADNISAIKSLDCSQSGEDIYNFLKSEWNLNIDYNNIVKKKNAADLNIWGSEEKNYTLLHSHIAVNLVLANGIEFTSLYHSAQKVPLYVEGIGADNFNECDYIYDIAPIICDIMGWDELPAIIE